MLQYTRTYCVLPAYAEASAEPFPGRIPVEKCVGETLWDTRTPDPAPVQMSLCYKTPLSEQTNHNKYYYNV